MAEIIAELRAEHRQTATLLDCIAREINAFEEGETPDYELIRDILDFLIRFPGEIHHPKEDLIYQRLRKVAPDDAADVGSLDFEHHKLSALTRRFKAALSNVLSDEMLPRDWFVEIASEYLLFQRRHMQMEEVVFFPAVLRTFSDADWRDIASLAADAVEPKPKEQMIQAFDNLKARMN